MAKPDHDYHILEPSPLPIIVSFALFFAALGGTMAMHGVPEAAPIIGTLIMATGLAAIIGCLFVWWKNVFTEGKKHHKPIVQDGFKFGFILFIISEVMFFVAFFWAYFNASLFPVVPLEEVWAMAQGTWPPEGIIPFDPLRLPFLNTLVLLLSGTTVTWAHYALMQGDKKGAKDALRFTVALGFIFTCLQAYEYSHAQFGFTDGVYASTFYLATGFHGLHVIIGTIYLAVCLARAEKGTLTQKNHLSFEFAAWYWHFVDVVWLFLFVFIYWLGYQNFAH